MLAYLRNKKRKPMHGTIHVREIIVYLRAGAEERAY